MDSPVKDLVGGVRQDQDASSSAPSVLQDSPIFSFINTLSPIKPPPKSALLSQSFGDLNYPAPPPIFTSPRIVSRETSFSRRFEASALEKLQRKHHDGVNSYALVAEVRGEFQAVSIPSHFGMGPCSQKTPDLRNSKELDDCNPLKLVDEFLNVSEEDILNPDTLSDPCSKQDAEISTSSIYIANHHQSFQDHSQDLLQKAISRCSEFGKDDQWTCSAIHGGTTRAPHIRSETRSCVDGEYFDEDHESECADLESHEDGTDMRRLEYAITHTVQQFGIADVLPQRQSVPHSNWKCSQQMVQETYSLDQGVLSDTPNELSERNMPLGSKMTEMHVEGHQQLRLSRRLDFEVADAHSKILGSNSCPDMHALLNSDEFDSSISFRSISHMVRSGGSFTDGPNISIQGSSPSTAPPKPSGIGLHLNRLGNTMTSGFGAAVPAFELPIAYRGNPLSVESPDQDASLRCFQLCSVGFVSDSPANVTQNDDESMDTAEVNEISSLNTPDLSVVKTDSSTLEEESCQTISKKKKRKAETSNENGGCRRCRCRKSKCLKLYCDCFAAGLYCVGDCTCQGCYNRVEFHQMVSGVRLQIESRDPIAFLPKVVVQAPQINQGETNIEKPASASSIRHKRGCNCKRSKCLKKYCECYQAGVGCSDGCRCEVCENSFGRKVSSLLIEYDPEHGNLGEQAIKNSALALVEANPLPMIESDPSKDTTFTEVGVTPETHAMKRSSSSPDSSMSDVSCSGMASMSANRRRSVKRVTQGNPEDILPQTQLSFSFGSVNSKKVATKWDRSQKLHPITPLAYCSGLTSIGDSREKDQLSKIQSSGRITLDSADLIDAERGSVTPADELPEKNYTTTDMGFDGGATTDVRDDVLHTKMLTGENSPKNMIKSTSPNSKRISPPHTRWQDLGRAGHSPAMRGRKLILQAVSFPPLTPHIEKKGSDKKELNTQLL